MKDNTEYCTSQQQQIIFSEQPLQYFSLRINPKLITKAINEGYATEVAFYYFLRFYYKHSRISSKYGNPKRKIAQLAGLSQPTIDKYFKFLIAHNLLFEDRRGYTLAIHRTGRRFKMKTTATPTVSIIKQLMFCQVLRDEAKHQLFMLQIKNYIKPTENNEGSFLGTITLNSNYHARFSVRHLASKLNISINTVRKVLKNLNARHVIRTVNSYSDLLIKNVMPGDTNYVEGYYGHRYIKNGCLFGIQPAQHDFLLQPVTVKEMTLRRYRNAVKDDKVRQVVYQYNNSQSAQLIDSK